jgi:rhodanese-related sulfurtransferase
MKLKYFLLFLLIAVVMTGCGGGATAVADPPADLSAGELDLGPAVDVTTVAAIKDRADVVLIDVREQDEYDQVHIPDITLIPLGTVPDSLDQIPTDKTVIMTCRSGNRSGQATEFLRQQGFDNVHNMEGGIVAWQEAGLPVE